MFKSTEDTIGTKQKTFSKFVNSDTFGIFKKVLLNKEKTKETSFICSLCDKELMITLLSINIVYYKFNYTIFQLCVIKNICTVGVSSLHSNFTYDIYIQIQIHALLGYFIHNYLTVLDCHQYIYAIITIMKLKF